MSGGPARPPRGDAAAPRQLERELAYYRRECNDLGARLLRLQEEQSQAFREARRSRTVAKLIREANRLADTGLLPDELAGPVLEIFVENAMCDRAALLRENPQGSGRFAITHAIGLAERPRDAAVIPDPPPFHFTTAQTPRTEPPAAELIRVLGVPYVLWAYDASTGHALLVGNRSEANVSRAFEPGDQELVEGGLSVYLDVLARKRAEMLLREAKAASEAAGREAEAARSEAERAARAKSDFLAAMSHEIRTPMTAVLGMADLLATEELSPQQRDYLEAVRVSGRHLLAVINDILDFSRVEAGRIELERVDLTLTGLFGEVRSLVARQAAERGLTVTFEIGEPTPPAVRGDPTRLRQVLLNLVGNGLKFTREGGVAVKAAARRPEDPAAERAPAGRAVANVRFEVRDTGIGIAGEKQAELFEPFSQADVSTTRRYGGTGLGLAICKRLVGAMGGTIGVESAPGAGSLFWFEVPLEVGEAAAAAGRPALERAAAAAAPLRVLVVEDTATNRLLLGAMLNRRGHEVVFAENGADAVGLAARERFDAVIMDVRMPVMDGVEATCRIRRLPPPRSSVPVLGLTADTMEEERRRCIDAGMDKVLVKPVVWPELHALLADVTAGRPPGSRLQGER